MDALPGLPTADELLRDYPDVESGCVFLVSLKQEVPEEPVWPLVADYPFKALGYISWVQATERFYKDGAHRRLILRFNEAVDKLLITYREKAAGIDRVPDIFRARVVALGRKWGEPLLRDLVALFDEASSHGDNR